jgi:hypothetical protein
MVGHKRVWGGGARNNMPTEIGTIFFSGFVHVPLMMVIIFMAGSAKYVLQKIE